MNKIFAREPIFDLSKQLFAYQFYYRNLKGVFPVDLKELSLHGEPEQVLSIDDLLHVNLTIVNVMPKDVENFAAWFSPDDVIVEISDMALQTTSENIAHLTHLKSQGFKIVLNYEDIDDVQMFKSTDFVKVDTLVVTPADIEKLKRQTIAYDIKLIATQVHNRFQFEQCEKLGVDLVQGFFFLEREDNENKKSIPSSKMSYMQLMSEISKPELNIDSLQKIFETDPALSFLLFKFINNPMVNKSYKISSIRHALNYLGELMVKRFVAIISMAGLNSDKPNELLNLSLSRAKFCELLNADTDSKNDAMSAFLVGLFSLIDVILEKDIAELLSSLKLDDKIIKALANKEGEFWDLLGAAKAIEAANWKRIIEMSKELGLSQASMFENYRRAVKWQNEMTEAVSHMYPVTRPTPVSKKPTQSRQRSTGQTQ
ncbi:EAL and HDOD domain-containing protein [Glaciecola petra]|uniref:HDOD domain-containing protein n=1 Tax=Glaciecola petra TaxID=3075602 RepID=A0ABU2ZT10_9ALTE|nr:HDOD domain-containing protein [Aestuariibacter sp. P117]MDT0595449.1 HDOD domain-containing protein [Aestuariibacter sp. P117]